MPVRPSAAQPSQMSLFDWIEAVFPSGSQAPTCPVVSPVERPRRVSPPGVSAPEFEPFAPVTGSSRLSPTSDDPPDADAAPVSAKRAALDYAHALGDREIVLAGCRVGYLLKRARRRSIGFVVSPDGLSVSAPRWVSVVDIEQALREKSTWILRKLAEQRERRRRLESSRIEWRDGALVPFKGESLVLVLDARMAGAQLLPRVIDSEEASEGPRWALRVGLPHAATATQIRDAVQAWLQQEALVFFRERCEHFSARLGVRMSRLRLSAAQTRWGSASVDGSIRLNWRLIHFSPAVIDYVVAHELAHLKEMNHSAAFWDVVRSVIPDLEDRRALLRSPSLPLMD